VDIIGDIIKREGSAYTNDPKDSGGPTKYGVTQRTLSLFLGRTAAISEVQTMTEATARAVYESMYITKPGYRNVQQLSERIANELIDTGVNCGTARATMFLQRALNALNRNATDYPDLKEDGDCGPGTINALRAYLRLRKSEGESVLMKALDGLQTAFYLDLARARPKDEAFVYGWLRNRIGNA
jgi:lysozyme family protein